MKRTPKQQRAGIARLQNAFGAVDTIASWKARKPKPRPRRRHLRRRIVLKYGG